MCACACVRVHTFFPVQCYLGSVPLPRVFGGGIERAEDLHSLIVGRLGCQDSLKALGSLGWERGREGGEGEEEEERGGEGRGREGREGEGRRGKGMGGDGRGGEGRGGEGREGEGRGGEGREGEGRRGEGMGGKRKTE